MTKNDLPSLCWDSNIFIAFANNETHAHPIDLFEEAAERVQAGEIRLVIPTIVIAEFHAVSGNRDVVARFDTWLSENDTIEIADLTAPIAKYAGDLRSEAGKSLKAFDAVVWATAIHRCGELWTRDKRFFKLASKVDPESTGCLVVYPESEHPLFD